MRESRSRAIGSSRASVFSGARRKVHPEAPGCCQMMPIASYRIRPAIGMGSILYFHKAKAPSLPGRWQPGCLSDASRRIGRTIRSGWQEGKLEGGPMHRVACRHADSSYDIIFGHSDIREQR